MNNGLERGTLRPRLESKLATFDYCILWEPAAGRSVLLHQSPKLNTILFHFRTNNCPCPTVGLPMGLEVLVYHLEIDLRCYVKWVGQQAWVRKPVGMPPFRIFFFTEYFGPPGMESQRGEHNMKYMNRNKHYISTASFNNKFLQAYETTFTKDRLSNVGSKTVEDMYCPLIARRGSEGIFAEGGVK